MALERQSIEKKDFPIGRRGYDPDAVDAHLSALADEVDELKRASRRRTETLASSASEQVRAIVEAAENSAAEIQRQAEEEAREIRAEASGEAQSTREQATSQARDYVGKVSESAAVMLQRLDAMESELSALIESLRTGSNRLNADLQLLDGNLTDVSEAVTPRPRFEPEPLASAGAGSVGGSLGAESATQHEAAESAGAKPIEDSVGAQSAAQPTAPESPIEEETEAEVADSTEAYGGPVAEPHADAAAAALPDGPDDGEGARLIALNMALNGTPREETDRYLAENFIVADRASLLDDVYASVDG